MKRSRLNCHRDRNNFFYSKKDIKNTLILRNLMLFYYLVLLYFNEMVMIMQLHFISDIGRSVLSLIYHLLYTFYLLSNLFNFLYSLPVIFFKCLNLHYDIILYSNLCIWSGILLISLTSVLFYHLLFISSIIIFSVSSFKRILVGI